MFGRKKEKRVYDDDDGRVIAPMNVDGMPWYRRDVPGETKGDKPEPKFDKEQTRHIILGTLKAALLIAFAFLAGIALVIFLIYLVSMSRFG